MTDYRLSRKQKNEVYQVAVELRLDSNGSVGRMRNGQQHDLTGHPRVAAHSFSLATHVAGCICRYERG